MTKKIIVKKKLCWFHEAVSFNFHKLCIRSAIQNILVVGTSSSFLLDKELLNNELYYQHFPHLCVTLSFQDSWRDLTRAFASGRSLLSLSGRLQVSGVTYVHIILLPCPFKSAKILSFYCHFSQRSLAETLACAASCIKDPEASAQ